MTTDIIKCYVACSVTETCIVEHQFAALQDGRVARCDVPFPTPHIGKTLKGRPMPWRIVDAIPAEAEYIGTYSAAEIHISN